MLVIKRELESPAFLLSFNSSPLTTLLAPDAASAHCPGEMPSSSASTSAPLQAPEGRGGGLCKNTLKKNPKSHCSFFW